jgi:hypothetical protein
VPATWEASVVVRIEGVEGVRVLFYAYEKEKFTVYKGLLMTMRPTLCSLIHPPPKGLLHDHPPRTCPIGQSTFGA